MRKEVFKIKQIKLYKPVVGDVVDEMFAGYLNKAKLTIEVQRISASNYMFGTKKILAKIINGRLVIRVGGGYMNAEEFIEQYGKIEMMKMMKMEETKNAQGYAPEDRAKTAGGLESERRKTQMGAEIKEKMRQSLMKITPYQTQQTDAKKKGVYTNEKTRNSVDADSELRRTLSGLQSSYSISKLNLPKLETNSPQPNRDLNKSNRTPLNASKQQQMKSPKSSTQFFNSLSSKAPGSKIGAGAHGRRATISDKTELDNLKPRGSHR